MEPRRLDETQKLPPPVTGRDLALIIRRRAKLALATFVVVVGATIGLTSQMPTVYEAKARVSVDDPGRGAIPSSILEAHHSQPRHLTGYPDPDAAFSPGP